MLGTIFGILVLLAGLLVQVRLVAQVVGGYLLLRRVKPQTGVGMELRMETAVQRVCTKFYFTKSYLIDDFKVVYRKHCYKNLGVCRSEFLSELTWYRCFRRLPLSILMSVLCLMSGHIVLAVSITTFTFLFHTIDLRWCQFAANNAPYLLKLYDIEVYYDDDFDPPDGFGH